MVQVINTIHPGRTIKTNTDENVYVYRNDKWIKSDRNYKKYFDTDVPSLTNHGLSEGDFLLSYSSKINYALFSESFNMNDCLIKNNPVWDISGLQITNNDINFRFPNTGKLATKFLTNNYYRYRDNNGNIKTKESTTAIEHSLSQTFFTETDKLYIASCFLKKESNSSNNIAFVIYSDTYGAGLSAEIDLNDLSGFVNNYKSLPLKYINSNYTVPSTTPAAISNMDNMSAGVFLYQNNDETYYFRIVLKFSCNYYSLMKMKLMILNQNKNYKYSSRQGEATYSVFTNAFQLEKFNDFSVQKPTQYIITYEKPSILKTLDNIYTINNRGQIVVSSNKLYYIHDIVENNYTSGSELVTYLESFKPAIENPQNYDIAVVPSLISFSTDKKIKIYRTVNTYAEIATSYSRNNNERPKENQIVSVKNDERHGGKQSLYQFRNNTWVYLLFDDNIVKLGDTYQQTNPENTLNYDGINSKYIIRKGDTYKSFAYKSDKKQRKAMIQAMTYNQGNFETWNKQDVGNGVRKLGFNTGGGFNYMRIKKFFPNT